MHAPRRESTTDDGDQGCDEESGFATEAVCERAAEEGAQAGAEEEEGVDGAEDGVGVGGAGAGLREREVLVEAGLADAGGEGGEAWVRLGRWDGEEGWYGPKP